MRKDILRSFYITKLFPPLLGGGLGWGLSLNNHAPTQPPPSQGEEPFGCFHTISSAIQYFLTASPIPHHSRSKL